VIRPRRGCRLERKPGYEAHELVFFVCIGGVQRAPGRFKALVSYSQEDLNANPILSS
jgi:hypothetical protein